MCRGKTRSNRIPQESQKGEERPCPDGMRTFLRKIPSGAKNRRDAAGRAAIDVWCGCGGELCHQQYRQDAAANGHHSRFAQFAGSVVDSSADGFERGVPRAESGVDWQSGWYARSLLRHHDGQYDWRERRRGAGAGTPGAASGGVEGAVPARQRRPISLCNDGARLPFALCGLGAGAH